MNDRGLIHDAIAMDSLTLLNSAVISLPGDYSFELLSLDGARDLIKDFIDRGKPVLSAIGHSSTAEFLSSRLEVPVVVSRTKFLQSENDAALVFRLKDRPAEGRVLNVEEIEAIGYEFGLLIRRA